MRYSWVRIVIISVLLAISLSMVSAQETISFISEEGVVIEHPNNWEFDQERDDRIGFSNSTMIGDIEYTELDDVDQDYLAELEEWAEDEGDDDDGIFTDIDTYTLADGWNAARTLRIRTDDRLFEVLIVAEVNDYMLYLDATFRIGAQDFYLPQFDTVLNSFRSVDDLIVHTISTNQIPLIAGQIGSEVNPLDIGALTANYVTADNLYQFDYPIAWQLDVNAADDVTFLDAGEDIIFGTIEITSADDDALVSLLDDADTSIQPEAFILNDLPAIRIVNDDSTNNVREVTMATVRGDIQTILHATMSINNADEIEAILRGVLYSVRPNGDSFTLSVLGGAVRTGLNSGGIYGESVEVVIDTDNAVLLNSFASSRNGQYTLSYPDDWFADVDFGYIILSTEQNYLLYEPDRNEAQILVSFFDQIAGFDGIDDFTPETLLEYLIDNSFDRRSWDDIESVEIDDVEIAYADFEFFGDVIRTYFIELDTERDIFIRLELIVDEDDVEDFHELALSILATARFQN